MKAALSWALVALVTWGVLELLARAWDHEYRWCRISEGAMSTAEDFRRAANAIEAAEKAEQWTSGFSLPDDPKIQVSWSWASSVGGYEQVRQEVQAILTEEWPVLVDSAIARLRARADEATKKVAQTARHGK